MKYRSFFTALLIILSLFNITFVWFYDYPLACDMPKHVAVAKAFLDLEGNIDTADYPYELFVRVAPYELSELLLALFIALFGVLNGSKIALTFYAIAFPFCIYFLVGQVNPKAKYSRLIGFPLTFNYFFHFGFWPFLLAMITAILAIGVSIRYSERKYGVPFGTILRLLTFLLHPSAALAVGLYDMVTVLLRIPEAKRWYNPLGWQWKRMLILWSGSVIFLASMFLIHGGSPTVAGMKWDSLSHQAIQLIRPLYITGYWWEFIIPILIGLYITVRSFLISYKSQSYINLMYAVAGLLLIGLVFPRGSFLGAWEQGSRIIFTGLILLLSLWCVAEQKLGKAIVVWIILAAGINLTVSHATWSLHNSSSNEILAFLQSGHCDRIVRTRYIGTPQTISIPLGHHVALWAWSENYIKDADIVMYPFGPVRHIDVNKRADSHTELKDCLMLYHPYKYINLNRYGVTGSPYINNKIYTMFTEQETRYLAEKFGF